MKPLYTEEELKKAKPLDKLPLECENCKYIFYRKKEYINNYRNPNRNETGNCCSLKCAGVYKRKKILVSCLICGKQILRHPSQLKLYPRSFCGKSCATKYSNAHKTKGNQRSKLEFWLEEKLAIKYPNLEILYNNSTAIGAELDIYIPNLKLAFEINGIFHYEPVFGQDKLEKTKNNDQKKFYLCHKNSISLCVIDSSALKYFKEEQGLKYLNIIESIINKNLN